MRENTNTIPPLLLTGLLLSCLPACNGNVPESMGTGTDTTAPPPGPRSGVVAETMDGGDYTYALIDTGTEKTWVAGPRTAVKVGDKVTTPHGIPMKGFESKTLKHKFDTVYFVQAIVVGTSSSTELPAGHPAMPAGHPPVKPKGHPPATGMTVPLIPTGSAAPTVSGTVTETMNAGRYTYVNVKSGTTNIWAAAPQFQVKAGAAVNVPTGMPMRDFHSRTLNRTFKLIYFAARIDVLKPKR